MSEMKLPICPICKREVLLPFSGYYKWGGLRVISNWICTNCGFSLTSGKNLGDNPKDVNADFNMALRTRVEYLRKEYKK